MNDTDLPQTSAAHLDAVDDAVSEAAFAVPEGDSVEVFNFHFAAYMLPEWSLSRAREIDTGRGVRLIQANASKIGSDAVARLEILETSDPAAGRKLFMETIARFQREPSTILRVPPQIGEAEAGLGQTAFAFLRGNLVVTITAIGATPLPVEDLARSLDASIRAKPDIAEDADNISEPAQEGAAAERMMVKVFNSTDAEDERAGERFAIARNGRAHRVRSG